MENAELKMQFLYARRSRGVTNAAVLTAMEQVDRAPFIRGYFAERAYEDMPPAHCLRSNDRPAPRRLKPDDTGTGSHRPRTPFSR